MFIAVLTVQSPRKRAGPTTAILILVILSWERAWNIQGNVPVLDEHLDANIHLKGCAG
jgi:hypothetical protein